MRTIHVFESTTEAYDACQCNASIKDGDLLHIPGPGIVGVAETWPFAVTRQTGVLHSLISDPKVKPLSDDTLQAAYLAAVDFAVELGYELEFPET